MGPLAAAQGFVGDDEHRRKGWGGGWEAGNEIHAGRRKVREKSWKIRRGERKEEKKGDGLILCLTWLNSQLWRLMPDFCLLLS